MVTFGSPVTSLAYLLGADQRRAARDDQVTGKLFENFVAMEIARLVDWAETSATQYHYRDRSTGGEIDVVLESRAGEIVCVECKAAATVRHADYRAIVKLRDARGEQFVAGVVVYTGAETKALTEKIWAVPVSALWGAEDPWSRRSSRRRRRWRCTIGAAPLDGVGVRDVARALRDARHERGRSRQATSAPDRWLPELQRPLSISRGPYPTMYRGRQWTMRQIAGFGTPDHGRRGEGPCVDGRDRRHARGALRSLHRDTGVLSLLLQRAGSRSIA